MEQETIQIPTSITQVFDSTINFEEIKDRYNARLRELEEAERRLAQEKSKRRATLGDLAKRYVKVITDDEKSTHIASRMLARIRGDIIDSLGIGSAQSGYAQRIKQSIDSLLYFRDTKDTPGLRESAMAHLMNVWDKALVPTIQFTTGPFNVDIGFQNTAGVASIDSTAVGKDERGNPVPGVLHLSGYSLTDLLEHTDFVGSVGIMLKRKPLNEPEREKLGLYMSSKAPIDDVVKQRIDQSMEHLKDDPKANAKLLMHCLSGVMHYTFAVSDYIDLAPLSLKVPKEDGPERGSVLEAKLKTFYGIADQGLALGARISTSAAYAIRKVLEKNGQELAPMPENNNPGLSWGANFLRTVFGEEYTKSEGFDERADALDKYFQLIRTHGAGNASSFATRVGGGAHADLYASLASGCGVLSGDRHGFANYGVSMQVEPIYQKLKQAGDTITDAQIQAEVERVWKQDGSFKGIGHPVYNQDPDGDLPGDPRAGVMEEMIESWNDPALNHKLDFYKRWSKIAIKKLEQEKGQKNRFPVNVDFYSGFLLQDRIGLPVEANTAMFEVGRIFGHLSNYIESIQFGLVRSKTLYLGETGRDFTQNGTH